MRYNGARIIVECLLEQGVDTVFGYPGGTILNVYDELYASKGRIRHILTSHEQHAAHAVGNAERTVYERLPALNVAVTEIAPKSFDSESDHAADREDPYQL